MRLTGKVVATYSGERFTDGKRRVEIRVLEADSVSNDIRITDETFQLDDQVTVFLIPGEVQEVPTTYDQAMAIIDESVRRQQEQNHDDAPRCLCIIGCSVNGECPIHGDIAMPIKNGLHVVGGSDAS